MIGEPLDELDEGGPFDQGHAPIFPRLEHNVLGAVLLREFVQVRGRQLERVLPLLVEEDAVEGSLEHALCVEHHEVRHPAVFVLGRLGHEDDVGVVPRRDFKRVLEIWS